MTTPLATDPQQGTWASFGKPQGFMYRGTGQHPTPHGAHYIGRVEEAGDRLRLYDLNDIERADISARAKFWAATSPYA